jgi:hypothetical protein
MEVLLLDEMDQSEVRNVNEWPNGKSKIQWTNERSKTEGSNGKPT